MPPAADSEHAAGTGAACFEIKEIGIMFYPELTHTVESIQTVIDVCCGRQNVLITVDENINRLFEYIKLLDPTNINFSKTDIFNKRKISAYWEKFRCTADALSENIDNFGSLLRVLKNTSATLKTKKDTSSVIVSNVEKEINKSDNTSAEELQQLAVAQQALQTLDNLIAEYNAAIERVGYIQNLCVAAFQQAIMIAKSQDSFVKLNTVSYEKNFRAVKSLMN